MAMYMKETDSAVQIQTLRQQMADPLDQMDCILTDNVIDKHGTLFSIHVGMLESLEKNPINVFLLFSAKKIGNAIRHKTTMSRTRNGNNPRYVTSL